eukprot:sb/3476097/
MYMMNALSGAKGTLCYKALNQQITSDINLQYFSENYDVFEELGKGSFSVVKRCVEKETKQEYAVKIAHVSYVNEKAIRRIEREERICRKLDHPNIVRLHNVYTERETRYYDHHTTHGYYV